MITRWALTRIVFPVCLDAYSYTEELLLLQQRQPTLLRPLPPQLARRTSPLRWQDWARALAVTPTSALPCMLSTGSVTVSGSAMTTPQTAARGPIATFPQPTSSPRSSVTTSPESACWGGFLAPSHLRHSATFRSAPSVVS